MCIRIIRNKEECSYNPAIPLEYQVRGAKQVVVNYEPNDSHMEDFVEQINRIIKNGIKCQMDIRVNTDNTLDAMKFERSMNDMSKQLELNEVIRSLAKMHFDADNKLQEISEICLERSE